MDCALFGGSFDPVHLGHLMVARAAAEKFGLKRIYFVPAFAPPHKQAPTTNYEHRYAMIALATAEEKTFLPSLLESPEHTPEGGVNYSIDTVRRFEKSLGKSDRAFFLIGMDAFKEISSWREAIALLREFDFIVASRPGYSLADVGRALPPPLRPAKAVMAAMDKQPLAGEIVLPGARIHLLSETAAKVSATAIRSAARQGRSLDKLVGPSVAAYIRKMQLYRS